MTVAGDTFLYIAFFFCVGRLYTNSLLASLNARKKIRDASDMNTTSDFSLSLPEFSKSASRHPANISIKIDTTRELTTDVDHRYVGEKGDPELSHSSNSTALPLKGDPEAI